MNNWLRRLHHTGTEFPCSLDSWTKPTRPSRLNGGYASRHDATQGEADATDAGQMEDSV